MNRYRILWFLLAAASFACVHGVAVTLSLYWYYAWFDILMHLWGGILLGVGVHVLSPISPLPVRPTTGVVLLTLLVATLSWEVFEWFAGLYDPVAYAADTVKDIVVGFAGGLLAHLFLMKRYNRTT